KFAFFGIACGGAKAGLVVPPDATPAERERRARAFGAALAPLVRFGTYVPGTDLGCRERDLWHILDAAGVPAGAAPPLDVDETSTTAAHSGWSAAIAAIAALEARGIASSAATLAIAGYGRVGAALAARFTAAGGRLVGVSTTRGAVVDAAGLDLKRLERLRAEHGDAAPLHYPRGERVAPAELLALDVDVLAPCATRHMLDAANAASVRCRIVAPGANAALSAPAEAALGAAGVTVLPDFVANAGGILVSHFWPMRMTSAAVERLLERHYRRIVTALLARAIADGTAIPALARRLARQNLARLASDGRAAARHERLIAELGRPRVRRLLPRALVAPVIARVARVLRPPLALA